MVRTSRQGAIPSEIGQLIEILRDQEDRIRTLEAPSGETAGAALPRTVANVEELLARRTLVAESSYSVTVNQGDPLPFTTGPLATIDFTLDARRRVYLRTSCFVALYSSYDGTGTVFAPDARSSVGIDLTNNYDGSITSTTSPVEAGAPGRAGALTGAKQTNRAYLDDYRILDPGDYTAAFSGGISVIDSTPAGYVKFYFPRLSVEIMEKA